MSSAEPLKQLDPLLDHAPCGYLSFRDDGRIALVNATLCEMLGYERDDPSGHGSGNSRNGSATKTVSTTNGPVTITDHGFTLNVQSIVDHINALPAGKDITDGLEEVSGEMN